MNFKNITLEATQLKEQNPSFGNIKHVNWSIVLNGLKPFMYSEGIGHFVKPAASRFIDSIILDATSFNIASNRYGLTLAECRKHTTGRVKVEMYKVTITPPKIEDVLYSLTADSDAMFYTFEDWCNSYDYDTDSIEVKKMYEACKDSAAILLQLGLNLTDLQEHFQDY